jgi:hypothetical protein
MLVVLVMLKAHHGRESGSNSRRQESAVCEGNLRFSASLALPPSPVVV